MGEWTKEPWVANDNGDDTHPAFEAAGFCGHCVGMGADDYARAMDCVNAMSGIPDPEKFVEAFDAMLSALRYSHAIAKNISLGGKEHHNGAADNAVVLIEKAIDRVLAAKPEEKR